MQAGAGLVAAVRVASAPARELQAQTPPVLTSAQGPGLGRECKGGGLSGSAHCCPGLLPEKVPSHCSLQRAPTCCHRLPGVQSGQAGDSCPVFRKRSLMFGRRDAVPKKGWAERCGTLVSVLHWN